jgi:hypothetical protein
LNKGNSNELNRRIEVMREIALEELQTFPRIWLWKSVPYIVDEYEVTGHEAHFPDENHMNEQLRLIQLQVINNLICNEIMIPPDQLYNNQSYCQCHVL